MADALAMTMQLAANTARLGWYSSVNWLMSRRAAGLGPRPVYTPERPVPSQAELTAELRRLSRADAEAVGAGLLPPAEMPALEGVVRHISRLREMLDDLPATVSRRHERDAATATQQLGAEAVPDYYRQDFHFQTGGYLSQGSARIYDVQVETLFYGSAELMRRAGLAAVAEAMRGRDQRATAVLDVACGTGRLLRQLRLAYPALRLTGLDLSRTYLDEAARHMTGLRPAAFVAANAEAIPLPDASQDVVVAVFLFHELPGPVRRTVIAEVSRVLRPGGTFVLVDSLQFGDRPGWDGLLEAFPVRFHEPYYRHFLIDDLDGALAASGLDRIDDRLAFLSKVMVRRKAG